MTTVTSTVSARVNSMLVGAADHSSPKAIDDLSAVVQLTSGVGANQADTVFSDNRSLAASANETLDLSGGALKDDLGAPANFAKVKAILIIASKTNVNNLVVGAAASNPFVGPLGGTAPTITIPPGGFVMLAAPANGWNSPDGVADQLKIANGGAGTPVDYDVHILGTSS